MHSNIIRQQLKFQVSYHIFHCFWGNTRGNVGLIGFLASAHYIETQQTGGRISRFLLSLTLGL